jgi:hypothetical protein
MDAALLIIGIIAFMIALVNGIEEFSINKYFITSFIIFVICGLSIWGIESQDFGPISVTINKYERVVDLGETTFESPEPVYNAHLELGKDWSVIYVKKINLIDNNYQNLLMRIKTKTDLYPYLHHVEWNDNTQWGEKR